LHVSTTESQARLCALAMCSIQKELIQTTENFILMKIKLFPIYTGYQLYLGYQPPNLAIGTLHILK
jgi:hypothetical protein